MFIRFSLLLFILLPLNLYAGETEIIGKDGREMLLIPEGEFLMGSNEDDLKEIAPLHAVYVDSFYMDKYEVTNGLFARFLNSVRPLEGKLGQRWGWVILRSDLEVWERETLWPTEIFYDNDKNIYTAFNGFENAPVISVSWYAADAYCRWAGKRLPTEAEWERAARGGLAGKSFPWGNEIPTGGVIFDRKWTSNSVPAPTENVGNYYPNGYGLFDMAGNVWEWCSDWYHPNYYKKSPYKTPGGPDKGTEKVLRGGSWFNSALILRVSFRNFSLPDNMDDAVGFRCAMDIRSKQTSTGNPLQVK